MTHRVRARGRNIAPESRVPALLITDIPRLKLTHISLAIRDAIKWLSAQPTCREERVERDEALIRLRQAAWHVDDVLKGSAVPVPDMIEGPTA